MDSKLKRKILIKRLNGIWLFLFAGMFSLAYILPDKNRVISPTDAKALSFIPIIMFIFIILGFIIIFKPEKMIIKQIEKEESEEKREESDKKWKEENSQLNLYKKALKGNDKSEALKLGRRYYSSLREDGRLTLYDEKAISNDLKTMK